MSWRGWKGKKLIKDTQSGMSDALVRGLEALGAKSDQQVPHDEGTLMRSKTIMKDPGNPLMAYIGYGGGGVSGYPIVPYAVKWHEIPANFQKGRKHNYLRDPVKSSKTLVFGEIQKRGKELW
jgi:hypothetical protein